MTEIYLTPGDGDGERERDIYIYIHAENYVIKASPNFYLCLGWDSGTSFLSTGHFCDGPMSVVADSGSIRHLDAELAMSTAFCRNENHESRFGISKSQCL